MPTDDLCKGGDFGDFSSISFKGGLLTLSPGETANVWAAGSRCPNLGAVEVEAQHKIHSQAQVTKAVKSDAGTSAKFGVCEHRDQLRSTKLTTTLRDSMLLPLLRSEGTSHISKPRS